MEFYFHQWIDVTKNICFVFKGSRTSLVSEDSITSVLTGKFFTYIFDNSLEYEKISEN